MLRTSGVGFGVQGALIELGQVASLASSAAGLAAQCQLRSAVA